MNFQIIDFPTEIISVIVLKVDDAKSFGHLLLAHRMFINSLNKKELESKKKSFYKFIRKEKGIRTKEFWLGPSGNKEGEYKMRMWADGPILDHYNYKNGKLEGKCLQYDFDQMLMNEYYCKNGLAHGKHKNYYHDDNFTRTELTIFNYIDGKKHGKYQKWIRYEAMENPFYVLTEKGNYINDKLHGKICFK